MPILPFGTLGSLAGRLPRAPVDESDPLAAIDAIIGVDRRTRTAMPPPVAPTRRPLKTPAPTLRAPAPSVLRDPLAEIDALLFAPEPEPPARPPMLVQGDGRNAAPDVHLPAPRPDINLPVESRPATSRWQEPRLVPSHEPQASPTRLGDVRSRPAIPSLLPSHMPNGQEPVPGFDEPGLRTESPPQTDLGFSKAESIGPMPERGPLGLADYIKGLFTSDGGPPRLSPKGEALLPVVGPIKAAVDAYDVIRAARRLRDDQGTDADRRVLDEFVARDAEAQKHGTTLLYDIANVVGQLPGFAAEFAMTGGAFTGVKTLVETALVKAGTKGALAKAAAYGAGAVTQTAAMPQRVAAEAARRQLPSATDVEQGLSDWDDDFLPALARAIPDTYVEVVSERTGALLEGPLGTLAQLPIAQRAAALKQAVMQKWLRVNPSQGVRDFFAKVRSDTGWNGVLGEIFEERVGEVMRAAQPYLTEEGVPAPAMIRMATGEAVPGADLNEDPRARALRDFGRALVTEAVGFALPGLAASTVGYAVGGRRSPPGPPGGPKAQGPPPVQEPPAGGPAASPVPPPVDQAGAPAPVSHPVLEAIDATLGLTPTPEFGEGAYAGPERRNLGRINTPDHDARFQRMREKVAAGEQTGTEESRADFSERQRVEEARRQGAITEIQQPESHPVLAAIDETLGITRVAADNSPEAKAAKQELKEVLRTKTPTEGHALLDANDAYEKARAGGDPAEVPGNEPAPWARAVAFDQAWGGWKKTTDTVLPTADWLASQGFVNREKVEDIKANFDDLAGEKPQIVRTPDGTLIVDGHHRLAAAMELGKPIAVQVYEDRTSGAAQKPVKEMSDEEFSASLMADLEAEEQAASSAPEVTRPQGEAAETAPAPVSWTPGQTKGLPAYTHGLPEYAQRAVLEDSMMRRTNEGGSIDAPDPYNGTTWAEQQVSIADILKNPANKNLGTETFGHRGSKTAGPIVINERGEVIDGNNRAHEAILRGEKTLQAFVFAKAEAPTSKPATSQPARFGFQSKEPATDAAPLTTTVRHPETGASYDRVKAQKTYTKFKTALTRAVNAEDWNAVIAQNTAFTEYYDSSPEPAPDDWSRWERAADDARIHLQRAARTEIGTPLAPKSKLAKSAETDTPVSRLILIDTVTGNSVDASDATPATGKHVLLEYRANGDHKAISAGSLVSSSGIRRIDAGQFKLPEVSDRAPTSKPAKSQPAAKTSSNWTEIGKNAIGQTLYEDQRGVRSYLENGARHTEPVQLRPTKAGMEISTNRANNKATTWEIATEHPAAKKNAEYMSLLRQAKDLAAASGIPELKAGGVDDDGVTFNFIGSAAGGGASFASTKIDLRDFAADPEIAFRWARDKQKQNTGRHEAEKKPSVDQAVFEALVTRVGDTGNSTFEATEAARRLSLFVRKITDRTQANSVGMVTEWFSGIASSIRELIENAALTSALLERALTVYDRGELTKDVAKLGATLPADLVPENQGPKQARLKSEQQAADGATVTRNDERSSVEVSFPAKPSDDVRERLKKAGFRWAKNTKVWYRKAHPSALAALEATARDIAALAAIDETLGITRAGVAVNKAGEIVEPVLQEQPGGGYVIQNRPVASKPAVSQPISPVNTPTTYDIALAELKRAGVAYGPGSLRVRVVPRKEADLYEIEITEKGERRFEGKLTLDDAAEYGATTLTGLAAEPTTKPVTPQVPKAPGDTYVLPSFVTGQQTKSKPVVSQPTTTFKAGGVEFVSQPLISKAAKLAARRQALEEDNRRLIAELKASLKNKANIGVDPDDVLRLVKMSRNYVEMGIIDFRTAVLRFQQDFGDGARALDRVFELAWTRLRGEDRHVADALKPSTAASLKAEAEALVTAYTPELVAQYWEQHGESGIIDNDLAKAIVSPVYAASRANRAKFSSAVQGAAGKLVRAVVDDAIGRLDARQVFAIVAGGPGVGKTEATEKSPSADYTFVTTMQQPAEAERIIAAAATRGADVVYTLVLRDPADAWRSVLRRAMTEEGRLPPISYTVPAVKNAATSFQAVLEKHAGQRNVVTVLIQDRQAIVDQAQQANAITAFIEAYNEGNVTRELERVTDEEYAAGRIDDDVSEAAGPRQRADERGTGETVRGSNAPEPEGSRQPVSGDESGAEGSEDVAGADDGENSALAGSEAGEPGDGGRGRGRRNRPGRRAGARPGAETGAESGSSTGDREGGTLPGPDRDGSLTPPLYTITPADAIGTGTPRERVARNFAAIRIAKQLAEEQRAATPEEQAVLVKYVGWGGLPRIFEPWKSEPGEEGTSTTEQQYWYAQHKAVQELLTTEEYARARNSTQNAHYTSPDVIRAMWAAVKRLGVTSGSALETSAGVGHFVGLMPTDLRGALSWALVEKDPLTAQIAAALYPAAFTQNAPFEQAKLPSDHFTVAIGNVPFGKIPITDPTFEGPAFVRRRIHNYFFGKALDKVAPGGLVAFITTHGTMDSRSNQPVREYLSGRADFLGAIRLPFTAFKANAGTEVVTDIIFLRKRHEGVERAHVAPWIESQPVQLENKKDESFEKHVNEYFLAHPEMVLGKHTATGKMRQENAYNVEPTGGLTTQLAEAIRHLPQDAIDLTPLSTSLASFAQTLPPTGSRPFEYLVHEGQLAQVIDGKVVAVEKNGADEARVRAFLPIREALREVYDSMASETSSEAETKAAQKTLTKAYDAFVKKYGYISEEANWRAFNEDPDLPLMLSLEDYDSERETAEKTAIFTTRTMEAERQARSADTPAAALQLVLGERGRIDLNRAGELLGVSADEATEQLHTAGLILDTPSGWQLPAQYLSGNVRVKSAEADAAAKIDPRYQSAADALKAVIPADIPAHLINVRLGASWVPPEVVTSFVQHLVDHRYGDFKWNVTYSPFDAKWNIEGKPSEYNSSLQTPDVDTKMLLLAALNDRRITIKTAVTRDTPSRMNAEATALARARREELHRAFVEWLFNSSPERREWAVRTYNDRFNAHVEPKVDGSYLKFHGMATYWRDRIREHQRNAVARVLQFGNTLFAHVVGAGKTLAMIASGMELRRMGLARKPLYVVPNHLISQWPSEFVQYYPNAKIMIARPEDLEKDNRKRFTARIASGDWDAVIMPYSMFVRVSMSPEAEGAYHREMLDEIETAIIEAWRAERDNASGNVTRGGRGRGSGKTPPSIKQLENMFDRIQSKLDQLADRPKDDMLSFEQLGVDALFVDEAHCFPYEAPVITDRGILPIGEIVERRLPVRVLSFDTDAKALVWKRIEQWHSNVRTESMVQVEYDGGVIVCTANHSIWTEEEGYLRADAIRPGHHHLVATTGEAWQVSLSGREDLRRLPAAVSVQADGDQEHPQAASLLESVRGDVAQLTAWPDGALQRVDRSGAQRGAGAAARIEGSGGIGAYAGVQSHGESGDARQNATVFARADVSVARRQWHADGAAAVAVRETIAADGVSDSNGSGARTIPIAADLLQGGSRGAGSETRDRGGRPVASAEEVAILGRQEDRGARRARVVGVTVLESGRDGEHRSGRRDDSRVYCLGVADTHSFFAYGALVSNSFKNLYFHTRQQAAGIPSDNDAQRATDLFLKSRYINKLSNYRNVVLATGTPVSNSMAEIFVMQKLLQEQTLKQAGIDRFDAWLAQFGHITTEMELDPSGTGLSARARLANFRNLSRLSELFRQVADIKMIDNLPELKAARPKLEGDAAEAVAVPATGEQLAYLAALKDRAEHLDPKTRYIDNMAMITNDGRMSALDMRLLDRHTPDNPGNKIATVVADVAEIYHEWKDRKGTQLIFLDRGTPGSDIRPATKEVFDPNVGERVKRPLTQAEKYRGFDLYKDIKKKLVKAGIHGNQIAFIHDIDELPVKKRDAARKALFRKVREGQIRVLIGSSDKMGTGMNVQDRLVAEHNVDPTYKPSETEQRYGRILRQGNLFFKADPNFRVTIKNYVTQGAGTAFGFDAYMWQLNEAKARFISKFFNGDVSDATTGLDLEQTVLTASEMKAIATGNPLILDLSKAQSEVDRLALVRRGFEEQQREARWSLESAKRTLAIYEQSLVNNEAVLSMVMTLKTERPTATIEDVEVVGVREISDALIAAAKEHAPGNATSPGVYRSYDPPTSLGTFRGLTLWLYGNKDNQPRLALGHPEDTRRGYNPTTYERFGDIPLLDPSEADDAIGGAVWRSGDSLGRLLGRTLESAYTAREFEKDGIEEYRSKMRRFENILSGSFEQDAEFARATAKLEDLQRRLGVGHEQEREVDNIVEEEPTPGPSGNASVGDYNEAEPVETASVTLHPIEFPELMDFARTLQADIQVVKRFRGTSDTRGKFTPGTIRIRADLFKPENLRQLAATLAHEIGHLADWLPDYTLKRGNLLGRLRTLHSFLKGKYTGKDGVTVENKEVRSELMALSKLWRPYDPDKISASHLAYRKSGKELYADAISVLLNNPGLLEQDAPIFFQEFFDELDRKPDVKTAYFDLQELLSGTREELIARRRAGVRGMFEQGDAKAIDLERLRQREKAIAKKDFWLRLRMQTVDKNYAVIDKVREIEAAGGKINPDDDPRYLLEERSYLGGKLKAWLETGVQPLYTRLNDAGVDWHTFGEALFYERIIAGDRSEIANPRGISPESAGELYATLKASLSPEQRAAVRASITEFRAAVRKVAEDAYKAGLYTDELYAQMQENPAYVSFRVIEHLEDGVTSRVYKQIGTLKDITNPADATILKTLVTMRAIEHQKVKVATFDMLKSYFPSDIAQAEEVWTGKGYKPMEPRDRDRQLITYYEHGKLRGKYVDDVIATSLNNESVGQNNAIVMVMRKVNSTWFRPIFTTVNLGFQMANVSRDFWRFWKNQPDMTLRRAVTRYWQAVPLARVRAFGLPERPSAAQLQAWDDLVQAEAHGILSITFNDASRGRDVEDSQIEDILVHSGIGGFQARPRHPAVRHLGKILDAIKQAGDFIETLPKAAGIHEYKGQKSISNIPPETRSFIRRKLGSPDFLAGGTWKPVTNEIFLFSNAVTQAWRSDLEVATDAKSRAGFWWKTAALNLVPKMLQAAALYGLYGLATGGDDEDKDDPLKRMMGRVSEYDLTNYIIVPLGERDHNTVYLRLPMDDTGRMIGGLFWKVLRGGSGDRDLMSTMAQVVDYSAGQTPSVAPILTAGTAAVQFAGGRNPYDTFRGREILTDDEYHAGGTKAARKFLGWEFQQIGGGAVWKFYPGETPPRAQSLGQKIIEAPILSNIVGRFVRISNYGETETLRRVQAEVQQDESQQRLTERTAINNAIRGFQQLPDAEQTRGAKRRLALGVARELYPTDFKERKAREDTIAKKLALGIVRGKADPLADAVLSARSNDQRVAILLKAKDTMSQKEYQHWLRVAVQEGVISPFVLGTVRRQEAAVAR